MRPQNVSAILDKFQSEKAAHSTAVNDRKEAINGTGSKFEPDMATGFTSDSDIGCDGDVPIVEACNNASADGKFKMSQELPVTTLTPMYAAYVTPKRKQVSVSERPPDIIYGRPKRTRSDIC